MCYWPREVDLGVSMDLYLWETVLYEVFSPRMWLRDCIQKTSCRLRTVFECVHPVGGLDKNTVEDFRYWEAKTLQHGKLCLSLVYLLRLSKTVKAKPDSWYGCVYWYIVPNTLLFVLSSKCILETSWLSKVLSLSLCFFWLSDFPSPGLTSESHRDQKNQKCFSSTSVQRKPKPPWATQGISNARFWAFAAHWWWAVMNETLWMTNQKKFWDICISNTRTILPCLENE